MLESIVEFGDIGHGAVATVGGRGAMLGELSAAGVPVVPGFVITTHAYRQAMADTGLSRAERRAPRGDGSDPGGVARRCRDIVREVGVPPALRRDLDRAFASLDGPVLVRASTVAPDTADASFAGLHGTASVATTADELAARVVDVWASLFDDRSVAYRAALAPDEAPAIAVVVQAAIDARRAGLIYTVDPTDRDASRVVIEAAVGASEALSGALIEPDEYVVAKRPRVILSCHVGRQEFALRWVAGDGFRVEPLDVVDVEQRVLSDEQVFALVALAARVEVALGGAQDIEWVHDDAGVRVHDSRPITALGDGDVLVPAAYVAASSGGEDVVCVHWDASRRSGHRRLSVAQIRDGEIVTIDRRSGVVYIGDHVAAVRRCADEPMLATHA